MKKLLYTLLLLPLSLFAQTIMSIEQDRPLNLIEGWNMIGFTCNEPIAVIDAFSPIVDKVLIAKDNNGAVYIPEFGFNGIGVFEYGYGYQLKLTESISDFQFCPFLVPLVEGCTDSTAFNFNSNANSDDGSCYPVVLGCLDTTAFNYNDYDNDVFSNEITGINGVDVNTSNGICIQVVYGCLDPYAYNFSQFANTNDESCGYYGCVNPDADNFDANATDDDESCYREGCMNYWADNYDSLATQDSNDICTLLACTDVTADNYDELATDDDGSCYREGCMVDYMDNYDSLATQDSDDVCFRLGCMSDLYFEYDSLATADLGNQCVTLIIIGCMDSLACNYYSQANSTIEDLCYYAELGYDCEGNITEYFIGMEAEGGIVFYVDSTGQHGLVAALEDIGSFEWGCEWIDVDGADGHVIGAGHQNTMDIVNQGCSTENGGVTAAQASLDYESNGFDDWYLPSKDELLEIYYTIGPIGEYGNIGGFEGEVWPSSLNTYYSSTEYSNFDALVVIFNIASNQISYSNKTPLNKVRPIRSF